MTLLPEEISFFFWAAAQLPQDVRADFVERVSASLSTHPNPDCGDFNRAMRCAFEALFVPPPDADWCPPRWDRAAPRFELVSKQAVEA